MSLLGRWLRCARVGSRRSRWVLAITICVGVGLFAACGRRRSAGLLAAASAAVVCEQLAERVGAIKVQTAASSTLARQVLSGAHAGVFVTAHPDWIDVLEAKGLVVAGSRRVFATNELVWIAPKSHSDTGPMPFEGRLAIADPSHVPAGRYAQECLQDLGLWGQVESRLAPAPDVRRACMLVETGQCDRGIVYRTDALAAAERVRDLGVVDSAAMPVRYEVCLLQTPNQPLPAELEFYRQLLDPEVGGVMLRRFGFRPTAE